MLYEVITGIRGLDGLGVELISPLGDDHVDHLLHYADIRLLYKTGKQSAESVLAGRSADRFAGSLCRKEEAFSHAFKPGGILEQCELDLSDSSYNFV